MAHNYCEFSSWLDIPRDKRDEASKIIEEVEKEVGREYDIVGAIVEIECNDDGCGVWFHTDDYGNPEHVEMVARELIERLEIDKPFICSWSYTCSKPRIDEFGGGSFGIMRGRETLWIDATSQVMDTLKNNPPPLFGGRG